MTITVVQVVAAETSSNTAYTATFTSNVTAGNSVILNATGATANNTSLSSSNPTFNGSSVTGSALAKDVSLASSSGSVYEAIWIMPNVAGGAKGVGLTVANNTYSGDGSTGLVAWEVSGLGTSPVVDRTASNTGTGTSGNTGTTAAITQAPEIVIAGVVWYGTLPTKLGSPWTDSQFGQDYSIGSQQIVASSGGTYSYATTSSSSENSGRGHRHLRGCRSRQQRGSIRAACPSGPPVPGRVGAAAAAAGIRVCRLRPGELP